MVYLAVIHSVFQYGFRVIKEAWGGFGIVFADSTLLTVQKGIIKKVLNKPKTFPTENLLRNFMIVDVQTFFIEIFEIIHINQT